MWLANVRDIGIILLALESLIIGALLALLLLQIRRLARLLEEEIRPLLDSTNKTIGTVQGTTEIVSETVVSPLVRISSYLAGLRMGLAALVSIKGGEENTAEEHASED